MCFCNFEVDYDIIINKQAKTTNYVKRINCEILFGCVKSHNKKCASKRYNTINAIIEIT